MTAEVMSDTNGNGNGLEDDDDEVAPAEEGVDRDYDEDLARYAPPPDKIAELAASAVRFVASKYKFELDFTSDTLSFIDQYVRDARSELLVKPEALDLLAATIGTYLGEVMRRAFGAGWVC